jgi:hypothetical protein
MTQVVDGRLPEARHVQKCSPRGTFWNVCCSVHPYALNLFLLLDCNNKAGRHEGRNEILRRLVGVIASDDELLPKRLAQLLIGLFDVVVHTVDMRERASPCNDSGRAAELHILNAG